MSELSDYDITEAMIVYGGGFVCGLGALWQYGDELNRSKLKAAFPEYWREYAALAELKRGQVSR